MAKRPSRADRARYAEPDEPEERGGGLKKVLLVVVCLAVLGAAGWYAFPHRATLLASAKSLPGRIVAVVNAMIDRKGEEAPSLKGLGGSPDTIDARLQATRLWRVVKQEFPDWYAERLKEAKSAATAARKAHKQAKVRLERM